MKLDEERKDDLKLINDLASHRIPFYAYGDNEAACEMSKRLEQIEKILYPFMCQFDDEENEWVDPAGGTHSNDEEDPAKMYE